MYDGSVWVVFFFFQAEDGIRDGHVTGVQTCALPICSELPAPGIGRRTICQPATRREMWLTLRSEERRVGKECRSRWSPYQQKKNRSIQKHRGKSYAFQTRSFSFLNEVASA